MSRWKRFVTGPWWPTFFSAVLGPGMGQILNGDFKKAMALLITSFGAFVWFSKVVGERLSLVLTGTPDEWKLEPTVLKEALTKLIQESPGMFILFYLLMFLLWIYGIVDAYTSAKFRMITKIPRREEE